MKRVHSAVEKGRCVVAVSGSLLRDASLLLALKDRADLPAVTLSGPAVPPVQTAAPDLFARAVGQQGGVVVFIDPQTADMPLVEKIAGFLKQGPHKPHVVVVAKAYNPFAFGRAFQGLEVTHEKARGPEFVKDLPIPAPSEAPAPVVEAAKAAKTPDAGPRFVFAGRDEEVEALAGMLGTGGPIVVSGPSGVGRNLIVEHAIAKSGLARLPDVTLHFSSGFDTLAARLAAIAEAGGSDALKALLAGTAKPAEIVKTAIEALQAASGTDGQVLVVHDLDFALGRQGDFFRKSRLELLVEALLTSSYPLRVVFVSTIQPVFYRESHNRAVRRFPVAGIKGRFLYEIFEAFHAPEFPREKFGPISDRIFGHPLAARTLAIAVRDRGDGLERVDDPKFLKADDLDDLRALKKQIRKQIDKLPDDVRRPLSIAAHFRDAVSGRFLADMGISRKDRSQLIHLGLLDVVGTLEGEKRYRVHPLVRGQLSLREITEFDVLEKAAWLFGDLAKAASGIERLAYAQRANQCAELGHAPKAGLPLDVPDDDALIDGLMGLLRRQEPRFDVVDQQTRRVLNRNPGNADAHLLRLRAMNMAKAGQDVIAEALDKAIADAPVPEVFHEAATFWLFKRARTKAISVMEQAVEALPDHSRLRTRLAALLLKQGRRPEALHHLQVAMELDPQLPDAYGLLGMARREEGVEKLGEAEELFREAVRLAPGDATQVSRLVSLLLDKARVVEFEERDKLRAEAATLLDGVLRGEDQSPEAQLLLATLIREQGGDAERAAWLLDQAKQKTDRHDERKFRVQLEQARLQAAKGELDASEKRIRELIEKDPSNDRVFAALAEVLVAKQLYIPAHAEYMRARERTPANSLACREYETEIARLAALIEAQAAGLVPQSAEPASPMPELHSASSHKVIRRRGDKHGAEASEHAEEPASAEASEHADASEEPVSTEEAASAEEPTSAEEEPSLAPPAEASASAETPEG